ncbi:MAG TPA: hypothetical protein VIL99_05975 [Ignavibacteria bacterium]
MLYLGYDPEYRKRLDKIDLMKDESKFKVYNSYDTLRSITVNYVLPIESDYKIEDYKIYLLYSTDMSENRIYQVIEKSLKKRIGWIFPINALNSTLHTESNNPHFLKYAFVAFQLLLLNQLKDTQIEVGNNYNITGLKRENSLFEDNLIIFIVNKALVKGLNFNLDYYLPSLYLYNYFYQYIENYNNFDIYKGCKRVVIEKLPNILISESYLYELFKELIFEKHYLVRFYLLYQVVELLIEKILNNEILKLANQLKEKEIFTREFKDKITNFEPEDKRIGKLFNEYSNKGNNIIRKNFIEKCNNFLTNMNRYNKDIKNIEKKLYSIRNFIVHDYRSIPKDKINVLGDVISSFEYLCIDLLLNYKEL